MTTYFLIRQSDGGPVSIEQVTDAKLRKMLAFPEDEFPDGFVSELGPMDNGCLEKVGTLIIKGEIVIPKPRTVVKEYDL